MKKGFAIIKTSRSPVLYSKVDLEYTTKVLENYTENNGYFNTKGL
jgi:hypothetical protein